MNYEKCQCTDCRQNIEYPEELCGNVINCPSCGRRLLLPQQKAPEERGFLVRLLDKLKDAKRRSANKKELRAILLSVVSDGVLTQDEKTLLLQRQSDLGLAAEDIRDCQEEIFESAFRGAKQRGHISPEAESALLEIQRYLQLRDSDVTKIKAEICRSRRIYDFQHGDMPPIQVPNVVLSRGESAYWLEPGTLYEEKMVSRRYEGGSSGVSFRLMKGVSFRVGNHRGQLVSETGNVPVSYGGLVVTNHRLIFQGDRKSFAAKFEKN